MVTRLFQYRAQWLSLAVIALAGWYLTAWLHMPIFPDETAIRLQSAHAIPDLGVRYPAIPVCVSGTTNMPWPLLPAAFLLSAFDLTFKWTLLRAFPFAVALAGLLTCVLTIGGRRASLAVLLLPLAFIGVSGSGLILMRGEFFLIPQAAACLFGYATIRARLTSVWICSSLLAILFFGLLSVQVHQQGLILFPISLLIMAVLTCKSRDRAVQLLGCATLIWMLAAGAAAVSSLKFVCNEQPGIVTVLANQTITGPGQWPSYASSLQPWVTKLHSYMDNFTFNSVYPIDYLPGIDATSAAARHLGPWNTAIRVVVLSNLIGVAIVVVWSAIASLGYLLERGKKLRDKLATVSGAGSTYLFVAAASLLTLVIIDTHTAFYRANFLHFAFVGINAIALSAVVKRKQWLFVPIGIVAVVLCLQSRSVVSDLIDTKFRQGWGGPSLPLATDWKTVVAKTERVAAMCGIKKNQPGVVVDDLTFAGLRRYPHLIAFTYVSLGHSLMAEEKPALIDVIRNLGSALVVQCGDFGPQLPPGLTIDGDMCCANFRAGQ